MANVKTTIDEWSVKDLEDNSSLTVTVFACTELGNNAKPGIQVFSMGKFTNFEPNIVEQWAYKAGKENLKEYFIEGSSWTAYDDRYLKIFLVLGEPLKARVEVKTRSSKLVVKEYELPFSV